MKPFIIIMSGISYTIRLSELLHNTCYVIGRSDGNHLNTLVYSDGYCYPREDYLDLVAFKELELLKRAVLMWLQNSMGLTMEEYLKAMEL